MQRPMKTQFRQRQYKMILRTVGLPRHCSRNALLVLTQCAPSSQPLLEKSKYISTALCHQSPDQDPEVPHLPRILARLNMMDLILQVNKFQTVSKLLMMHAPMILANRMQRTLLEDLRTSSIPTSPANSARLSRMLLLMQLTKPA